MGGTRGHCQVGWKSAATTILRQHGGTTFNTLLEGPVKVANFAGKTIVLKALEARVLHLHFIDSHVIDELSFDEDAETLSVLGGGCLPAFDQATCSVRYSRLTPVY